jgi:penicillin-binding protein 2
MTMREKIAPAQVEKLRLRVIQILIAAVLGFFIIKMFTIMIIEGKAYSKQADTNRISEISISTQRGIIYDRNGYVLARNIASFNVAITPADLPSDLGAIQEIYRQLSELINIPVSNGEINDETVRNFSPCQTDLGITEIVYIGETNAPYSPVRIICNISQTNAMIIRSKSNDWPGVSIEIEQVRDYPTGSLTAQVIGFLGPIPAADEGFYRDLGFLPGRDKVGYAGVENSLDDLLRGLNGKRIVEVDSAGKVMRDLEAPVEPVPGNNIKLTIDTRLQAAAEAALVGEINFWNTWLNRIQSSSGVVIAMNPKTGEILALVSYPSYENNRMARLIPAYYYNQLINDPNKPLFNRAISAELPPGSVFKISAAIGALNEGVITPEKEIFDPGHIDILQKFTPNDPGTPRQFVCYNRTGHGYLDFLHGVAYSCDVYFYKIGGGFENEVADGGLGIWRMSEYAKALGYASQTGIELPGEATGLIPDPRWKRVTLGENWSTGDTYIATIGQGYVLATPLQVLLSFATIANDGKMMKPTLVEQVLDSEGNVIKDFTPTLIRDITKEPVINLLDENNQPTGEKKVVEPWVIQKLQQGLRLVVTIGTAKAVFTDAPYQASGKTGTAEYCDDLAKSKNLCQPENWPSHSWYVGFAPYDNPEIAVVAFVYNGGEGASVAAPIVRSVLDAYFELKAIDSGTAED